MVLIAALLSIIWTFADFQLIYILTKGGPANTTHIFGTYAYQIGLSATEIGQGAAIALYMFPILAVFAILLLDVPEEGVEWSGARHLGTER